MVATLHRPDAPDDPDESRFLLDGVPWSAYVALRDALDGAGSRVRMTYLDGMLELMSPSSLHEDAKKIIARLIELWAMERDVDLRGFGSTTFKRKAKKVGLEPDECYKLGKLRDNAVPDVAIEVLVSRRLVDKLDVYAGLGIPEVWEWRPRVGKIVVHRLVGKSYEQRERSEILPDLDIAQLSTFVKPGQNQTRLAKAYQAALRRT
jgi:Uma2 family endonuclease